MEVKKSPKADLEGKKHVVVGRFRTDLGSDVCGVRMDRT